MDFTLQTYRQLLHSFQAEGYIFYRFEDFLQQTSLPEKYILLRHDVDAKVENSLATAKIEKSLGISASYYFRVVPQSDKPEIIEKIKQLGHEIGYHYEDMSLSYGNFEQAKIRFESHLNHFRTYYSVKTICMHGSPTGNIDNRDIWKQINYKDYGIIGEPYFDIDFSKLFYLTDTGRRWDGYKVSIRDKISIHQDRWIKEGLVYHSTDDIIKAVKNNTFPKQLMITTHPQRWTDNKTAWLKEWMLQTIKNSIKRIIIGLKKE